MKFPLKIPQLSFPNNSLPLEKNAYSIKTWQKLCIFYTIHEVKDSVAPQQFSSMKECILHCDEIMGKYAEKLLDIYADIIPRGLTKEELCSKCGHSSVPQDDVDFYQYEFNRIRSQLCFMYNKLWVKVKADLNGESMDLLLYEVRKRLFNRMRRRVFWNEPVQTWFPIEWLCFLTFGTTAMILDTTCCDLQKLVHKSVDVNNMLIESFGYIQDFPKVSFLYNTLSRNCTKQNIRIWQRLCCSFTMIDLSYHRETASIRSSEKADYIHNSYRHYAKCIMQYYRNDIPEGLTVDLLCQYKSESIFDSSQSFQGDFFDSIKLERLWGQEKAQINKFGMKAWEEAILPVYNKEDFHNVTLIPIILSTLRRCWWELVQENEDSKGDMDDDSERYKFFDPNWFPLQWLTFLCFGPISKISYFTPPVRTAISNNDKDIGYTLDSHLFSDWSQLTPNTIHTIVGQNPGSQNDFGNTDEREKDTLKDGEPRDYTNTSQRKRQRIRQCSPQLEEFIDISLSNYRVQYSHTYDKEFTICEKFPYRLSSEDKHKSNLEKCETHNQFKLFDHVLTQTTRISPTSSHNSIITKEILLLELFELNRVEEILVNNRKRIERIEIELINFCNLIDSEDTVLNALVHTGCTNFSFVHDWNCTKITNWIQHLESIEI